MVNCKQTVKTTWTHYNVNTQLKFPVIAGGLEESNISFYIMVFAVSTAPGILHFYMLLNENTEWVSTEVYDCGYTKWLALSVVKMASTAFNPVVPSCVLAHVSFGMSFKQWIVSD